MNKEIQINQILESAQEEIIKIISENSKMQKKFFIWLDIISKELHEEKNNVYHFCKNQFLSEICFFQDVKFRKITSLSDLNKNGMIKFLSDVQTFFINNYNIDLL